MSVPAILNEAADLIERHGLLSGDYGNPDIGFCAIGAITWAAFGKADVSGPNTADEEEAAIAAVHNVLEGIAGPGMSIGHYNDSHSQAEVIELLLDAAKEVAE